MHKALCMGVLSTALLSGCAVYAEEAQITYTIHLSTEEGEPKAKTFLLYEDEECLNVLMDGEEAVSIKTDESGSGQVTLSEGVYYLKEQETDIGFYAVQPVLLSEDTEIVLKEIHASVMMEYEDIEPFEITYSLLDEEGTVLFETTTDGQMEIGSFLQAGGTYTIKEQSDGRMGHPPHTFSVDMYQGEDISIVMKYRKTGSVQFACMDAQTEIHLYENEEKVPLYDSENNEVTVHSGETLILETGIYYYSLTDISASYYDDNTLYELEVAEEEMNVEINLVPAVIHVCFEETLPYTVTISDSSGAELLSFVNTERDNTVPVQRDQTYTIVLSDLPMYYTPEERTAVVPQYYTQDVTVSYATSPFSISVVVKDSETDQNVQGARICVTREHGRQYYVLQEEVLLSGIYQNETLSLKAVSLPQGYLPSDTVTITINGEAQYQIVLYVRPYFKRIIQNEASDQVKYGLFADEACMTAAADIYGSTVDLTQESTEVLLYSGTYYLKQISVSDAYYPDSTVYKVSAANVFSEDLTVSPVKVQASFRAVHSETGALTASSVLRLETEDGEVIATWHNTSEKVIELNRNTAYILRAVQNDSGFRMQRALRIQMQDEYTSTVPQYTLKMIPYYTFSLQITDKEAGIQYMVYEDALCTKPAEDIDGRECTLTTDDDGRAEIQMYAGTYYLKQVHVSSYYFLDTAVLETVIGSTCTNGITISLQPVSVLTAYTDENGTALEGGEFAILNEEGVVIDQWISDHTAHQTADNLLEAGKSYTVHEIKAAEGYESIQTDIVFHVPETYSGQLPIVTMTAVKQETAVKDMEEVIQDEENMHRFSIILAGIGICIVLCFIVRNKKQKSE